MCVCRSVSVSAVFLRVHERVIHPLELELNAVVSCQHGCWELNSGPLEEEYRPLSHLSSSSRDSLDQHYLFYDSYRTPFWHQTPSVFALSSAVN